ncbi:MAG TPA: GspE/PulE family protein [Candidatus Parcubacteria bacterium]|nr:GspE/PulE family protein [Candidatus Parcubacteria bacterium]
MTLIQHLVKKGIINKEKAGTLEYEAKTSGKNEEEVILKSGIINQEALFDIKAENLNIPLKKVVAEDIPLKVLELIPEDSAKYYQMIPIFKKENLLEVGMVYPEELKAQEALKFWSRQGKFKYKIFLITPTTFNNLLKQYKTLRKEVGRALEELETELKSKKGDLLPIRGPEVERMVEEAPVTKVVAVILRHAVDGSASDIHIEPTRKDLRIRFRLDGILHSSILLPLKIHPAVVARIKILTNLKIDETRVPQDGRFSAKINERNIDFRVSTFPTTLGEKVVLRVLDPKEGLKTFEDLGLEGRNLEVVKKGMKKSYGLILVTGPTGSGKTTTLYIILNSLNKEGSNIVTLEDPVEYFMEGINQSQIRPEIGYNFAQGLRHILRQDPDIIMVGEIRDEESAALVTHAALTGHIVLSTLHTTNALGAIPRLIDLKVAPFLIPSSLSLVLAQRLVRRLCPDCKKKVKPKDRIKNLILKEINSLPESIKRTIQIPKPLQVYQAVGCKKCKNEGYLGRIAIFEVLEMTDSLAEIILKEPSEAAILKEAQKQEMITMRQDGILKVLDGVTSVEEALRVIEQK